MHDAANTAPPARRVAVNTVLRAIAEALGKLAGLALLAYVARELSAARLGEWIFALALMSLVSSPVGSGIDRLALRDIARDRPSVQRLFTELATLKLLAAGAGFALLVAGVAALGYPDRVVALVAVFAAAEMIALLAQSTQTVFQAFERGEHYFYTATPYKVLNSALGIVLVAAGMGIVGVAVGYLLAAIISLTIGSVLMRRHFARPRFVARPRNLRALMRAAAPFSAQEALGQVVVRMNVVLLSLLTTSAVVGYYGASHRLVEATLFLAWSVGTSVLPMYAYLEHGAAAAEPGQPSLREVYEASLKFVTAIMLPIAVTAFVCAEAIIDLAYGLPEYGSAVVLLRWLSASIVIYGVGNLAATLVLVRRPPRYTLIATAGIAAFSVALNLALIPPLGAEGAAIATLATEVVLATVFIALARPEVGLPRWLWTLGAPLTAGAAMAAAMSALRDDLLLALPAGALAYLSVLAALEARNLTGDVNIIRTVLARRRAARAAGTPS